MKPYSLVVAFVAAAAGLGFAGAASAQPVVPPCEPVADRAVAAVSELARFNLGPVGGTEGCGLAEMAGAWSPFGLAVARSGHLQHELRLHAVLPPLNPPARYVAWAATPALDRIQRLGVVVPDRPFVVPVHWNQVVVVVSREEGVPEVGAGRWAGPIVLLGRSRSAFLQNLMGHSIFRRAEM